MQNDKQAISSGQTPRHFPPAPQTKEHTNPPHSTSAQSPFASQQQNTPPQQQKSNQNAQQTQGEKQRQQSTTKEITKTPSKTENNTPNDSKKKGSEFAQTQVSHTAPSTSAQTSPTNTQKPSSSKQDQTGAITFAPIPQSAQPASMPQFGQQQGSLGSMNAQTNTMQSGVTQEEGSSGTLGKLLVITLILITIGAVAGGGYWYYTNRAMIAQRQITATEITPMEDAVEEPESTTVPEPVYSQEQVNVLEIDESSTPESLARKLSAIALTIETEMPTDPIRFRIEDENGNPMPFEDFAAIMDPNFPSQITAAVSDTFELRYYYYTEDITRTGLVLNPIDSQALENALRQNESQLVSILRPLMLGEEVPESVNGFSTSQYKGWDVRYINLNTDETLSIDYVVGDDVALIGTSMFTLRKMIDEQ
jgi:hypothetical protein